MITRSNNTMGTNFGSAKLTREFENVTKGFLNKDVTEVQKKLRSLLDEVPAEKVKEDGLAGTLGYFKGLSEEVHQRPQFDVVDCLKSFDKAENPIQRLGEHFKVLLENVKTRKPFERMMEGVSDSRAIFEAQDEVQTVVGKEASKEKATINKNSKNGHFSSEKMKAALDELRPESYDDFGFEKFTVREEQPPKKQSVAQVRSRKKHITQDKANQLTVENNSQLKELGLEKTELIETLAQKQKELQESNMKLDRLTGRGQRGKEIKAKKQNELKELDSKIKDLEKFDYASAKTKHEANKPTQESVEKNCKKRAVGVNKQKIAKYSEDHTPEEIKKYVHGIVYRYKKQNFERVFAEETKNWESGFQHLEAKKQETLKLPEMRIERDTLADDIHHISAAPIQSREKKLSTIDELDGKIKQLKEKDYDGAIEQHLKLKPTKETAKKDCVEKALEMNKKTISDYAQAHSDKEVDKFKKQILNRHVDAALRERKEEIAVYRDNHSRRQTDIFKENIKKDFIQENRTKILEQNQQAIDDYKNPHSQQEVAAYRDNIVEKYVAEHIDKTLERKNEAWEQAHKGLIESQKEVEVLPVLVAKKGKLQRDVVKMEKNNPELAPVLINEKELEIRAIGKRINELKGKDFDKLIQEHKKKEPSVSQLTNLDSFQKEYSKWSGALNRLNQDKSDQKRIPQMRQRQKLRRRQIAKLRRENPDFAYIAKKQRQVDMLLDENRLQEQIHKADKIDSVQSIINEKQSELTSIEKELNIQAALRNHKANLALDVEIKTLKSKKSGAKSLARRESMLQGKLLPLPSGIHPRTLKKLEGNINSNQKPFEDAVSKVVDIVKKNAEVKLKIRDVEARNRTSNYKMSNLKEISDLHAQIEPIPEGMEKVVDVNSLEKVFKAQKKTANLTKELRRLEKNEHPRYKKAVDGRKKEINSNLAKLNSEISVLPSVSLIKERANEKFKVLFPEHEDHLLNRAVEIIRENLSIKKQIAQIKNKRDKLGTAEQIQKEIDVLESKKRPTDVLKLWQKEEIDEVFATERKLESLRGKERGLIHKEQFAKNADKAKYKAEKDLVSAELDETKKYYSELSDERLSQDEVQTLLENHGKTSSELESLKQKEEFNVKQKSLKGVFEHQLNRLKKLGTRSKTKILGFTRSGLKTKSSELAAKKQDMSNQSREVHELASHVSVLKNEISNIKDQITSRDIHIGRLERANDSLRKRTKASKAQLKAEKRESSAD